MPEVVLEIGSLVQIHGYHLYECHDFWLTAIVTQIEPAYEQGIFVEIGGGRAVTCNPCEDTTPSGAWVYPEALCPLSN
jgi:hypothetical protein